MTSLWLLFILCAALIVVCGTNLSRYGDVIAEKTGLGRAWIGLILMASVTSLPELITGISSVTIADTPDIAVGNIIGACVLNLSIIALMDLLHGPGPIFSRAEHGHILSAGYGIILIGVTSLSMLANEHIPAAGHVSLSTPAIMLVYAVGIRSVFLFEKRKIAAFVGEMAESFRYDHITKREATVKYAINAVFIIAAATWLPFIGDRLARETGLGQSFVGTVFVAMATTLPELTVSLSALRIGAVDMAIANLFGSNMFNIVIIAIDDVFYVKGPLLSAVSASHVVTGLMAALMTGIAVVGLTYRVKEKAFLRLSWDALALLLAYVANVWFSYLQRGGG
jgi:cation:H+ antiporter